MTIGERRINMMRIFNSREGIDQEEDIIPKKLTTPIKGGPTDGVAVTEEQFQKAKETYYEMAGWDKASGTPPRKKLEELGLGWISDFKERAK